MTSMEAGKSPTHGLICNQRQKGLTCVNRPGKQTVPFSRKAKTHTSPSMALKMQKGDVPLYKRHRLGQLGNSQAVVRLFSVPRHLAHSQKLQGTETKWKVEPGLCCLEENAVCPKFPQKRLRRK